MLSKHKAEAGLLKTRVPTIYSYIYIYIFFLFVEDD